MMTDREFQRDCDPKAKLKSEIHSFGPLEKTGLNQYQAKLSTISDNVTCNVCHTPHPHHLLTKAKTYWLYWSDTYSLSKHISNPQSMYLY